MAALLFRACGLLLSLQAVTAGRDGSCEATTPNGQTGVERGVHALLQVRAEERQRLPIPPDTPPGVAVAVEPGSKSRELLPPDLVQLGIYTLGSEESLDALVSNTRLEHISYAGIDMVLRMVNGDLSNWTMNAEGAHLYGLDTLDDVRKKEPVQDKINMVDIGGNYGVVSIAAFKSHPTLLRSVAVEPIPSTYFLLRWNMWLNGVPALEEKDLNHPKSVGILALNRAVVSNQRDSIEMCYTPPFTMNAFICNCKETNDWPGRTCKEIKGITMKGVLQLFGSSPITLAKLDCEGCEMSALQHVEEMEKHSPNRIRRLSGELHHPSRDLENVACMFEKGQFFVRLCATERAQADPLPVDCGETPVQCLKDSTATELMREIGSELKLTQLPSS